MAEVPNNPDGLQQLGQLALDAEEELLIDSAGDSGGSAPKLILRRSELAILRRMSNRYPITEQERASVVSQVVDIACNAKSKRLKISAAKAFVAMDRVNLDEVKTLLAAKQVEKSTGSVATIGTQINVQIIEQVVQKEDNPKVPVIAPSAVIEEVEPANGNGRNHH